MTTLEKKIDFALIIKVDKANPNGDPLNGNRPRVDYDGFGEITDVCLKRKLRDRLVERYQSLAEKNQGCLLYTSPSPRDKRQSRMPSSA